MCLIPYVCLCLMSCPPRPRVRSVPCVRWAPQEAKRRLQQLARVLSGDVAVAEGAEDGAEVAVVSESHKTLGQQLVGWKNTYHGT